MTTKQPSTNIEDVQRQIIESLRRTNKELAQRNQYLEDVRNELNEIKSLFAANPGANWSMIQSIILTRQNANVAAERQQRKV